MTPKSTTKLTAPRRQRGMAGLATALTGRTDALARRSTEADLTEAPSAPGTNATATDTTADEVATQHSTHQSVTTNLSDPETDDTATVAASHIAPATSVTETPAPTATGNAPTPRAKETAPRTTSRVTASGPTPEPVDTAATDPLQPQQLDGTAIVPAIEPASRVDQPTVPDAQPARPFAGPEGRLEASGEQVVKWTLELAPQIVMALNVWERDETRRLGERVYRERLIDEALDRLPSTLDDILATVSSLPMSLRRAPGQQFGTRVRGSVRDKLIALRPELRVAGIKDVRIRDIYSAGVYRYLTALGVDVREDVPNLRH